MLSMTRVMEIIMGIVEYDSYCGDYYGQVIGGVGALGILL